MNLLGIFKMTFTWFVQSATIILVKGIILSRTIEEPVSKGYRTSRGPTHTHTQRERERERERERDSG